MQIIIPMSGFGERFRRAGYSVPKPLILVDGKPIIAHVVDMFPGDHDFIFICNEDHLKNTEYRMRAILNEIAPKAQIVSIAPHKLGPVNAVNEARAFINPSLPTIVNYCDFACYWNFEDFERFVVESDCDGAIPAYKGFHPHSLGSTYYAYMQHNDLWLTDIQEKQPFTEEPIEEYASSGTYYFRSGALCLDVFQAQMDASLHINGEFYASLAYKILLQRKLKTAVYDLQHFMQWGTPGDLEEYLNWSKIFRTLIIDRGRHTMHDGTLLLPMAGLGSRFSKAGYDLPKPLIPVSGRPMVIQATNDLPVTPRRVFVTRKDLPDLDEIRQKIESSFINTSFVVLDGLTEGQAITCLEGMDNVDPTQPVTIGACDNGVLFDPNTLKEKLHPDGPDVLVWTVRGHPDGRSRPKMFGWVNADDNGVIRGISVKKPLHDPATDPLIVGAFTFRRASDFIAAAESLVARDCRVNGEFYVDSLIEDAVNAGLRCEIFEIDAYIGWGTPIDLAIFEYWQSCFHKWPSHPYRLQKDSRVPASRVQDLEARYRATLPPRPRGVQTIPHSDDMTDTAMRRKLFDLREASRFGLVGGGAVLTDLVVYLLLVAAGAAISPAKGVGFCTGAALSYFGNRYFTFQRRESSQLGVPIFLAVYGLSLLANITTNMGVLSVVPDGVWGRLELGWLVATSVSAVINYFSLKYFVFNGDKLSSGVS